MKKNTGKAIAASQKARTDTAKRRKQEIFRHGPWYITHFDDFNYRLQHDEDGSQVNRYYSTLAGALYGIARYVRVDSLDEAMRTWEKLGSQIAALDV